MEEAVRPLEEGMLRRSIDLGKIFQVAFVAFSFFYLIYFLYAALWRIWFQLPLISMEHYAAQVVWRILSGLKIYAPPSVEWTASVYPPFYFYVSAAVSAVTGQILFSLRLVSLLASLGCFFFVYIIVKKETDSVFAGIAASGLLAATHGALLTVFDVGRVDALFLLLILASIYLIRFNRSLTGYVLAGILLSLSFLTKQTALFIAAPLLFYCLMAEGRLGVVLVGIFCIFSISSLSVLNAIHEGWYYYYIFSSPAGRPFYGPA